MKLNELGLPELHEPSPVARLWAATGNFSLAETNAERVTLSGLPGTGLGPRTDLGRDTDIQEVRLHDATGGPVYLNGALRSTV
jgi:hypothetical protein